MCKCADVQMRKYADDFNSPLERGKGCFIKAIRKASVRVLWSRQPRYPLYMVYAAIGFIEVRLGRILGTRGTRAPAGL